MPLDGRGGLLDASRDGFGLVEAGQHNVYCGAFNVHTLTVRVHMNGGQV